MIWLNTKNIAIFLLIVLACFSIFLNLDANFIQLWDEGLYAVPAYEMCLNGNYLVKFYDGLPDMVATNPPLVCYFQVLCMKIFGPGELAVRMPSALAALGVVLLIIRFSIKEKLGLDFAFYAVLFLITSHGYVGYHVARTGDLDSVLIFFIIGSIIYFYKFIEYEEEKKKYLLIFSLFILGGFFTKGIASLLVTPAFIIYAIIKNKVLYVLKSKQLYFYIFSILFLIILYYYLRELKTPGYVRTMLESEVGRWNRNDGLHAHPFWFYLSWLYESHFKYFLILVPVFLILYFFIPRDNYCRKKSTIWLVSFITFFLVISFSTTKLEWYDAPLIPMLSIFLAFGLKSIIMRFKSVINFNRFSKLTLMIAKCSFIFFLFMMPYISIIQTDLTHQKGWHDINFGRALRQYNKLKDVPKKMEMLYTGLNGHAIFYKLLYNHKFGYNITSTDVGEKLTIIPNKVYLFTHPGVKDYLEKNFNFKTYFEEDGMMVVRTLNPKHT
ncbi:MAG TPA: glycosyltransferase family 39 protein [Bacteroidia bacterium]|jgi:4-amino-4-deoxy-L-arabinose transferase-like glycosyltransferase|nr:glycosyltransferase family 39 protein [Bacteroidia bacterium]